MGRTSKRKGANFERALAKKFQSRYNIELKRTPQSGGFAKKNIKAKDFRGDITLVDEDKEFLLHIEAKNQKTWKLKDWLKQAEDDCPEGRVPLVIFHKHDSSKDYVCLTLEDFFQIVERDKVVRE